MLSSGYVAELQSLRVQSMCPTCTAQLGCEEHGASQAAAQLQTDQFLQQSGHHL